MRRRGAWLSALGLALLVALLGAPASAAGRPAGPSADARSTLTAAQQRDGLTAAEKTLADRYAPVVMLRTYDHLCSHTGEPYVPMAVDPLLDNPQVALRQVGNGDAVIRWGPSAKDLYGLGSGTYLDWPGETLKPGCTYAEYSAGFTSLKTAAIYGHVATEASKPGYLAVQYWLYSYYNDWNNRHESDWEFVQVLFKAGDAQEALATAPVSVGYSQHYGGEAHAWRSPAVSREGTHPVVFTAQGSHASFFASALYLGRDASEGFGCDNTQGPLTRVVPRVVLLPDAPSGPDDPLAWLDYRGRWGERHSGPNDAPTGPAEKTRWTETVSWQEGLRPSSFEIPGGSEAPPPVLGAFCRVVTAGSQLYLDVAANPARGLAVLALAVIAVALAFRRTAWSEVSPLPIVARRRAGQIIRASARTYRRRPLVFLTIGLLAAPAAVIGVAVSALLIHLPLVGRVVQVSTDRGDPVSRLLVTAGVNVGLWPISVVLVSAAVAELLGSGRTAGGRGTLRPAFSTMAAVGHRLRDLAVTFVPAAILILLLDLSVIGIPLAAWLSVRYQLVGQVVMLDRMHAGRARRRSSNLVSHRWWHTAMFTVLIWTGVHAIGVLIGLLLLVVATSLPLWAVSMVMLVAEVALTPVGAIALTLLYGDAAAEKAEAAPHLDELVHV